MCNIFIKRKNASSDHQHLTETVFRSDIFLSRQQVFLIIVKKTFISCEMKQLFFPQMKTWNLFSLFRLEDINIFGFSTFFLLLLIILRMGTIWFLFAESGSEMQSVIIHKHKSKKVPIIYYIKMKVCVCVCVSGGLPPDPHKPSPQNLAWAPHFTQARHQARGQPKMLTPGPTPKPAHGPAHSPAHFCSLVP